MKKITLFIQKNKRIFISLACIAFLCTTPQAVHGKTSDALTLEETQFNVLSETTQSPIPLEIIEQTLRANIHEPYITPESPLYYLKLLWEYLLLLIVNEANERLALLIRISEERLSEATYLVLNEKERMANVVFEEHLQISDKANELYLELSSVKPSKTTLLAETKLDNQEHKLSLLNQLVGEYQLYWSR